jgi:hypothetical protein
MAGCLLSTAQPELKPSIFLTKMSSYRANVIIIDATLRSKKLIITRIRRGSVALYGIIYRMSLSHPTGGSFPEFTTSTRSRFPRPL